ncbi:MAG: VWA domain-containing protein [Candidatus Poribacteria bacterium]|nr:VWA domain-containing protein [Candidatus Poribacteria bacterium]
MCLILATVGLQQKSRSDILSVTFLLDVSGSIPSSKQAEGIARINDAVNAMNSEDEFSVIRFAARATIGTPMQPRLTAPTLTSEFLSDTSIDGNATDIASAIQLGMVNLPEARQTRFVLLSDGLQNINDANEILDLVEASGIEIFTIPLNAERENEVWVRDLQVPPRAKADAPFTIRAIVESTTDTQATVRLYHNNVPVSTAQTVQLEAGKQVIDSFLPQRIRETRNHVYRVDISAPIDSISENNSAYGLVGVYGRPRILYVESEAENAARLKTVLEKDHFNVDVIAPSGFPTDLALLQGYDAVILSNVSADEIPQSQMVLIDSYVRDLGNGLVAIGGDRAFGVGGYHDTPLERVLPVDMTPKQRKESVALMLVVDASGSMEDYVGADQKIELAIEGVRAAVRVLDEEDRVGLIGFAANPPIKMFIAPTNEHERINRGVGKLSPGGGTEMYPSLEKAHEVLKEIDAKQKHIILLSDGKSDGAFTPLARRIAADQISVTTIAIGDAAGQQLMQSIAREGQGNYKYVRNVSQLPKVFVNAVRQTQKYTIQQSFQPTISEFGSQILAEIGRLPKLYGYIATSGKERAQVIIRSHENHPILAAWNYGLGRAAAFTSDVKPGWGADWIEWKNFGKFWGQVVNWVLAPNQGGGEFNLHVLHRGGEGQVVVDDFDVTRSVRRHEGGVGGVVSETDGFVGHVARPRGGGESIELQRVTPTRYEGGFPIRELGAYHVTVQEKLNGALKSSRRANLIVSYPGEFAEFKTNRQLLAEISRRTDGIFDPSPDQILERSGKGIEHLKPLSGLLLAASFVLFVVEMILRRVTIASGYLSELRAQLRVFRRRDRNALSPTLSRLSETKSVLRQPTRTGAFQQRQVPTDALLSQQASASASVQPQVEHGGTGRLLAAKKRAGSGS